MTDLVPPSQSPFDAIRHQDDRGEYWLGREVQPLMGYTNWRQFALAVDRAKVACSNSGASCGQHFEVTLNNPSDQGGRPREDVRLTRFGAYLVALNGDPRKPEVARGQAYFAIKTREAETRPAGRVPATIEVSLDDYERLCDGGKQLIGQLRATRQELETTAATAEERRRELVKVQAPLNYLRTHVDPRKDTTTFTVLAKQLGLRSATQLYDYLKTIKVVWKRAQGRRWTSRGGEEIVYQWLPCSGYESWFKILDQIEAPPLHNGQLPTTLYVLPPGKVGIAEKLASKPIAKVEQAGNVTDLRKRHGKKKPGCTA